MAVSGVRVDIRDAQVISALNTPGGEVNDWRNETERMLLLSVFARSPINHPDNARHRPAAPPPGTYQRSWVTRRQGNRHRVGFQIENFADHAVFVEFGRRASVKVQTFSWTQWGGQTRSVGLPWDTGTKARKGKHVLRDATNAVMSIQTDGAYSPLT